MEIKGDPFKGFLRALAAINLKLQLEEKIMEHDFKVGDNVMRKSGVEIWTICDILENGEQLECQSTFDGRVHTFFWKGLKLAPPKPAGKFKVGDIVVQTGTCEFYTVGELLDDGCVEMMPNEQGFSRRFHESALELAPPIGDAYVPHIPKATIEVDHTNWGKSKVGYMATLARGATKSKTLSEIRKSMESCIGYPGVSYFHNLEHTYVPNEDDLKYIKDDMEMTMKMYKEMTTNPVTHEFICEELYETYKKKNKDYGDSFAKSLDKHGLIAAIVRMDDKMSRLVTLEKSESIEVNESMRDTVMDLANYAIMTAMWMDENATETVEIHADNLVLGRVEVPKHPSMGMRTPEEWEKVRARFESEAEVFDAGLKAGLTQKYDIYADNLKLTGADYDGDTTNS